MVWTGIKAMFWVMVVLLGVYACEVAKADEPVCKTYSDMTAVWTQIEKEQHAVGNTQADIVGFSLKGEDMQQYLALAETIVGSKPTFAGDVDELVVFFDKSGTARRAILVSYYKNCMKQWFYFSAVEHAQIVKELGKVFDIIDNDPNAAPPVVERETDA